MAISKANPSATTTGSASEVIGKDISIFDLARKISTFVDYKGEIIWDKNKPDGTPKKQLNTKKINSLGWFPKIKLDDGIKKTIENYSINYL